MGGGGTEAKIIGSFLMLPNFKSLANSFNRIEQRFFSEHLIKLREQVMYNAMKEEINQTEKNENVKQHSDENEAGTFASIINCLTEAAHCIGLSVSFDMR